MLRINQQRNPEGAKAYFTQGLGREDYYCRDEILGRWGGRGAERLGLDGDVTQAAFMALCDNQHPHTGDHLTARTVANRTVAYDFTWNAPKSLSVLHALTKDERLLDAFRAAVREAMNAIEADIQTRVRQGGQDTERTTGNILWAEFIHTTARPVGGVPDPHLHCHAFVFNATYDNVEEQWKAAYFRNIKRDAVYYEALFHSHLSQAIAQLGYGIERTKNGWEIAGLPPRVLKEFSRRTAVIEATARQKGVNSAKEKAELGAKTREAKQDGLTAEQLQQNWEGRLTPAEQRLLQPQLLQQQHTRQPTLTAQEAVEQALQHGFERASVQPERRVLATALKRSYGSVGVAAVQADLARRPEVIRHAMEGQMLVTTRAILAEENAVVRFAREGRGRCRPLGEDTATELPAFLNPQQQAAVRHVLTSTDRVMLIRGAAGTGKTTLLKTAAEIIQTTGREVHVFAPTTEAARSVLRREGFEKADTVARLLVDERLQQQMRGQVIWVDEAGLMGVQDTRKLFQIAEQQKARVVLMGDHQQHAAVARGDTLRLLQDQAGLHAAVVADIRRQQGEYKAAIEALAQGDVATGFEKLDRLGSIHEVPDATRHTQAAQEYVAALRAGKTSLVIAPTHAEGYQVTVAIRAELQQRGLLAKHEQRVQRLDSYGLTESMRADSVNFRQGDIIQYHQNAKGFKKGERLTVTGHDDKGAVLVQRANGSSTTLPLTQAKHFDVYEATELRVAIGEQLRVTQNATSHNGRRLINGTLHTVRGFDHDGNIVLKGRQVLAPTFGHVTHGYVGTSHASQGKTVDRVIVCVGPESYPAASRQQFYVSASRAKERCTILCADKQELREAVQRSAARMTATELAKQVPQSPPTWRQRLLRHGEHLRRMTSVRKLYERIARDISRQRATVPTPERDDRRNR